MIRLHPLWVLATLLVATQASAMPVITIGSHDLLPNTDNQPISISVTGGDPVQGVNLYLQVGDGTAGPMIDSIDVVTGTIFAGHEAGQSSGSLGGTFALPYWNGYASDFVIPVGGSVAANGLLATLTINTTGFSSGTWTLSADFDYGSDHYTSDLAGVSASINNGSITIVPEPASLALLLATAAGLAVWQWRRRR